MSAIQSSISIADGTVNSDVLSSYINATIPPNARGALVRFAYTGSAAGLTSSAWVGVRNPVEVGGVSAQNRIPIEPDDVVERNIPALPNERIRLYVSNASGGALTFFFRVTIDEIG
jgi:hypothetical protein